MSNTKEKKERRKVELLKLTMTFSKEFLNEEYENVIEKLINKMARKREVPFLTGRIEIWAAAVIHAVGTVNFLFDKSTQPYVAATDIYSYFDTKQSTTSQRSKQIRDMFKMTYFDSDFSIESVKQSSPFNNLTQSNGFIVPQYMEKEKYVYVGEREIQMAQVLGIKSLELGETYKESDIHKLFQVEEASLMKFYEYLSKYLTFPFTAIYEEEVGPFEVAGFEVDCLGLEQKMKIDETYGILMECMFEEKHVVLPLGSIILDEKHNNYKWIDLYLDWFWSYR
ncbi:DUF6398 domain-containing protein [Oceanobacillus luteolus]|uniref:DUF6398 domain-containing protein n=1 Tax=Oceanobacillus luteolus TaxID=1274358 RepID=UPI0020412F4E|nr:DUF6398 domain-containing protein [Oceanobacillus luteolus]MCM3740360.1 DUF6398 domain-containing protein [Oceanobacillus luteolus]